MATTHFKPANSSNLAEENNNGKFQPGQSGNPAGRKPGSKNKRTLAVLEACQENDFDPLVFLIDVAKNGEINWKDRIKAACEVNACLNPKLKAVAHSGINDGETFILTKEEFLERWEQLNYEEEQANLKQES